RIVEYGGRRPACIPHGWVGLAATLRGSGCDSRIPPQAATAVQHQHPGEPDRADRRLVSALAHQTPMTLGSRTMDLRSRTAGCGAAPAGRAFSQGSLSNRQRKGIMATRPRLRIALIVLVLATQGLTRGFADSKGSPGAAKPRPVNFAREVRPILSDN